MFPSFVMPNKKDYYFHSTIIALIIVLLLAGLKMTNSQGIDLAQSSKSSHKTQLNAKHQASTSQHIATFNMFSNNGSETNPVSQNPWLQLVQFTVDLAGGLALFITGNIALSYYRRPLLKIDEKAFLQTACIDVTLYEIDIPRFSRELVPSMSSML